MAVHLLGLDGEAGEMYLAGPGVARGYVNGPGVTAARFVPDPFGPPGTRMYRTGDLARRRADGDLEFLGRADDQVKIRGYRVEPGEIETVLAGHEDVRQVAVTAEPDPAVDGDRQLVAYVVSTEDTSLSAGQLGGHVAAVLPEYMVPSVYVRLAALPLTPNGKVDRAALPALRAEAPPDPTKRRAASRLPHTPDEVALCAIYAEILAVPHVGVDDSFFALGGNSLKAIRLVSRIRKELGMELAVKRLFAAPTPAELLS